jgi:hypothetical protein
VQHPHLPIVAVRAGRGPPGPGWDVGDGVVATGFSEDALGRLGTQTLSTSLVFTAEGHYSTAAGTPG